MPTSRTSYIPKAAADATYRPNGYGMSEGLKRAREPYRVRNAITGLCIGAFAVGVWAYSISAVKQDNFDDIDAEARALGAAFATPPPPTQTLQQEDETLKRNLSNTIAQQPRGFIPRLVRSSPLSSLLDPMNQTLIWDAPPIERLGRMSDPR